MHSANLLQARLQTCDWSGYDESVRQVEQLLSAGKRGCLPGPLLAFSYTWRDAQLQCARIFVADKHGTPPPAPWKGELYRHERIGRICVADFREHPVAALLVGVLNSMTVSVSRLGPLAAPAGKQSDRRAHQERLRPIHRRHAQERS